MQLFDPNNPNEKKKMVAAAVLGLAAIIVLGYLFFGGGSKKTPTRAGATPTPAPGRSIANSSSETQPVDDVAMLQKISYTPPLTTDAEADRNIFAYYVPPPTPVKPVPTPSPAPPPPLTVSSVSPSSVYGRTGDFPLQVVGDKFTPFVRITIDGRVMPTRFLSAQQLATTVTADLIANPGNRRIEVRSPDGTLYSNAANLVVTPPPDPRNSFSYIGLIGKPRGNDIAVLQDKNSKDFLNVQRGDVVGGRFRLTSISDKEIVLVDTTLKIKHTLPFSTETSSQGRPPVRRPVVSDEEPEL
jgi:hypothetical protein